MPMTGDDGTLTYDNAVAAAAAAVTAANLASGVIVVNHAATAGTARPTTHKSVVWVGSVVPTNATEYDIYLNTAATTVVGYTA